MVGLNSPDGNKLSYLQFLDVFFKAVSSLEDFGAFLLRYRRVKEPVPKSEKKTSYRTYSPKDDSEREAAPHTHLTLPTIYPVYI